MMILSIFVEVKDSLELRDQGSSSSKDFS